MSAGLAQSEDEIARIKLSCLNPAEQRVARFTHADIAAGMVGRGAGRRG